MSVEYPDLSDYLAVAAAVTGIEPEVLLESTKLDLADSALRAPAGSWGVEDFYQTSSTRRQFSLSVWQRTIHFSTAISERPG